jgi:putative DNA methylase
LNSDRKRLIELSLPLAKISEQSAREKSIRHGHISTLHIWWARRPLAAMRAAIFASLVPAPDTDEERERLERLIATIVDWDQVKDGNSEAIEEARALIRRAFPDRPPRLLDPFMGGGSTGLEALRLGCETHAVELNPVAHLIELCTLVYPQKYGQVGQSANQQAAGRPKQMRLPGQEEPEQLAMALPLPEAAGKNTLAEDVRRWGEWVLERAREEIGPLYANPAGDETIVGYLWARTVKCPNPACGAEMPLVRQWWLANTGTRKIVLVPVVGKADKRISFEIVDMGSSHPAHKDFDPSQGTVRHGDVFCLICSQVADVEYIRSEGLAGRMGEMPLAVIYEQSETGKGYRSITESDLRNYDFAKATLQQLQAKTSGGISLVPDEVIPTTELRRLSTPLYGIDTWGKLFNARQALALATFSGQIRAAYDAMLETGIEGNQAKAVATYLAIGVDRLADFLSTLCTWTGGGEFVGHTFVRHALGMVWDYTEINPFSESTGNWKGALEWIALVIEHVAKSSAQWAVVQQGTATRLPYSDNHFDAIITDPPYYDSVPYSHLADFFYVWLKRSVGTIYSDAFRTPLTPKGLEIVQDRSHSQSTSTKDEAFYEREMTHAFAEARRVLRPDGIFVVVFAHKSTAAWETLLNSLLEADLVVTASWPLHTERSSRIRAQGNASLASSIFIVCRVRAAETEGYFDDVRQELAANIRERLDFFWRQGIRGADFFISAIGPAVSVFGRYRKVYRLDGAEVGVGELLDLVQASVAEYALDRILNGGAARMGGVDAPTRYYILHRWAYGSAAIPFDDAMRLAMALGADVSALMERRGILKQSGETVHLLGPRERAKVEGLGLPDKAGRAASVVDVLHQAVVLWEAGDREGLARFLAEGARGREEQVRLVAQTLVNILPDDDAERRLLEGFLAGRDVLPEVARQERLL